MKDIGNRGIRELRTVRTVAVAADARSLSLGDQRPLDERDVMVGISRALASPTSPPMSGHKGVPGLSCVRVGGVRARLIESPQWSGLTSNPITAILSFSSHIPNMIIKIQFISR